jgi:NCS1 family nucleobase:cation symporter-1
VHDVSAAINNALLIMLYLLAPWTAINLVDYFLVRRGHYDIADPQPA